MPSRDFSFPLLSLISGSSQAGDGAGRLRDDRREGREALPHDDDQEPALDQRQTPEAQHRAQVLHGKVSLAPFYLFVLLRRCLVSPGFQECDCGAAVHKGIFTNCCYVRSAGFQKSRDPVPPESWQHA